MMPIIALCEDYKILNDRVETTLNVITDVVVIWLMGSSWPCLMLITLFVKLF